MTTGNAAPARRLPSVRRVTCGYCDKSFIPRRRDQEFCNDSHRKAESRRQQLRAEAERHFKTDQKIVENAHADQHWLGQYRSRIARMHASGLTRGVEFSASPKGILVAETVPGALAVLRFLGQLRRYRETVYQPGDPDIPKLIGSDAGAPFVYREATKGFAAAMRQPVESITLFTFDRDYFMQSFGPVYSLPSWFDEEENRDGDYDYANGESGWHLLAAGGFQVKKP